MELVVDVLTVVWQWMASNSGAAWAALSGTFFGAYFAFLLERKHQASKERDARITAGKAAQFALVQQLNGLTNIRRNYLDPLRADPNRHLRLTPFSVHHEFPQLPVNALSFLLDREGVNVLSEAMVAEHRFQTLIGSLNARNSHHERMQLEVARSGSTFVTDPATLAILKDMTDAIYGQVDDAIAAIERSIKDLKDQLDMRFPGPAPSSSSIVSRCLPIGRATALTKCCVGSKAGFWYAPRDTPAAAGLSPLFEPIESIRRGIVFDWHSTGAGLPDAVTAAYRGVSECQ